MQQAQCGVFTLGLRQQPLPGMTSAIMAGWGRRRAGDVHPATLGEAHPGQWAWGWLEALSLSLQDWPQGVAKGWWQKLLGQVTLAGQVSTVIGKKSSSDSDWWARPYLSHKVEATSEG
jgi:hypothetical protein